MNISHKTDTKHYQNKQIQKSDATSAWTLLSDSYLQINATILSPHLVTLLNVHMCQTKDKQPIKWLTPVSTTFLL